MGIGAPFPVGRDDSRTCESAVNTGHLDVLKWARELHCRWDVWNVVVRNAAYNGHLHMLQWVRKHGCPWNWRTYASISMGGHLDVLKWVRRRGIHCAISLLLMSTEQQKQRNRNARSARQSRERKRSELQMIRAHAVILKWRTRA